MSAVAAASVQQRSVVLVTPDTELRHKLSTLLAGMRWEVFPASGGAEAMMHLGNMAPEAMIVDHWLPDLDAAEFAEYAAMLCPATDMLQMDGSCNSSAARSARRNELLHALREAQEVRMETSSAAGGFDGAAWLHAPVTPPLVASVATVKEMRGTFRKRSRCIFRRWSEMHRRCANLRRRFAWWLLMQRTFLCWEKQEQEKSWLQRLCIG